MHFLKCFLKHFKYNLNIYSLYSNNPSLNKKNLDITLIIIHLF